MMGLDAEDLGDQFQGHQVFVFQFLNQTHVQVIGSQDQKGSGCNKNDLQSGMKGNGSHLQEGLKETGFNPDLTVTGLHVVASLKGTLIIDQCFRKKV